VTALLATALAGLGLGLSLIIAIGAQNAFVLRQGIRSEHVLPIVVICTLSDTALILAGIGGLGIVVTRVPLVLTIVRIVGGLCLIGYGLLAVRRVIRGEALVTGGKDAPGGAASAAPPAPAPVPEPMDAPAPSASAAVTTVAAQTRTAPRSSLRLAIVTALALTWLNPSVYIDTALLIGSIANTHGPDGRWVFGGGAIVASAVWFVGIGFGARLLAPLFSRPAAWRILDAAIALIMFGLGAKMLLGL